MPFTGTPSRVETIACACCGTCASGKQCFQEWIAVWSCITQSWSGPVTDNRLCLAVGTAVEWAQIASDDDTCTYKIRVPYNPVHCCDVNSDCSGLGDTETPALPFGGGPPTDCPCNTCLVTCGCRTLSKYARVSFDGVENGMPCTKCGGTWYRAGTLVLGAYLLRSAGSCGFGSDETGDIFEVAAGVVSEECPEGPWISAETDFQISLGYDPVSHVWFLSIHAEDFQLFYGEVDEGDCTGPLVFENQFTAYDVCGTADPQTFAVMIGGTATVVFPPCVPPT